MRKVVKYLYQLEETLREPVFLAALMDFKKITIQRVMPSFEFIIDVESD